MLIVFFAFTIMSASVYWFLAKDHIVHKRKHPACYAMLFLAAGFIYASAPPANDTIEHSEYRIESERKNKKMAQAVWCIHLNTTIPASFLKIMSIEISIDWCGLSRFFGYRMCIKHVQPSEPTLIFYRKPDISYP